MKKILILPFFVLAFIVTASFTMSPLSESSAEKTELTSQAVIPVSLEYPIQEDTTEITEDISTPEPVVQEPDNHRDDIISDGNQLSYELQDIMQGYSAEYDVPYALLLAIAETETHFDADAVSVTCDYGLMQINKCNHEWLTELGFDPLTYDGNIAAGAYIISTHLEKYGDIERSLMAYNCGPGGAKKLWDSGVYQTDYTRKVMSAYKHWTDVLNNEYEEE